GADARESAAWQCLFAEEVVPRCGSGVSGNPEEQPGRSERAVCDGYGEGGGGQRRGRIELVPESVDRRCVLDAAADEAGGARSPGRRQGGDGALSLTCERARSWIRCRNTGAGE